MSVENLQKFIEVFRDYQFSSIPSDPRNQREVIGNLVQFVGPSSIHHDNTVQSPFVFKDDELDQLVEDRIRYFVGKNKNFEWKLFDFDNTLNLIPVLLKNRFQLSRKSSVMFAPTDLKVSKRHFERDGRDEIEIVKVSRDEHFLELQEISGKVWKVKTDDFFKNLQAELDSSRGRLDIFLARHQGTPITCGWVRHYENISFFFGGSTIEKYRGLGAYTRLVEVRTQAACERQTLFVVSECTSMSEAVLQGVGFKKAGHAFVYNFDLEKK